MSRDRAEDAVSDIEDARAEARARQVAAKHVAYQRSHRVRGATASDLLWDAAAMSARQAAGFLLIGHTDEAAVQARAFRLLDASWLRLVCRRTPDRAAQAANEAQSGPAAPPPRASELPRPAKRRSTHGRPGGVDGP